MENIKQEDINDLAKAFKASIENIETNQKTINDYLKSQHAEQQEFKSRINSSIGDITSQLQSINVNETDNTPLSQTLKNPASATDHQSSHRFNEALKTVGNPNFLFSGNPNQWALHKKRERS